MDKNELWQAVLAQIQLQISSANFATWFKNTQISSHKDGTIFISVPNAFAKEWLEQKYNKTIFKILHSLDRQIRGVAYETGKVRISAPRINRISEETEQLEFNEFTTEKESNLNPRYTFESFIIGPFNELAQAASWATAQSPGQVYNPLFIYGGVGLGKTHLLQAIGNQILKDNSQKKIKYIPSEKFVSEVITSIRNHQIEELKAKYQQIDVLIIDDVQFLTGKEKTQEEFFYTFNSLYEKNKQIILSSDRPPKAIPALAERLRSRFEGGMIADISLPDLETRIAILKAKSMERKIEVSEEILSFISSNVKRNIRELEGALNILVAYKRLNTAPLDIKTAKSLLKNLTSSQNKIINAKKIVRSVAMFYDLKEKDLLSSSRKKEIVHPRQIAMYLLRKELKASFPFIGRKLGGKDHTTAIHSFEKITNRLEKDESLGEEIDLIKQRILYG